MQFQYCPKQLDLPSQKKYKVHLNCLENSIEIQIVHFCEEYIFIIYDMSGFLNLSSKCTKLNFRLLDFFGKVLLTHWCRKKLEFLNIFIFEIFLCIFWHPWGSWGRFIRGITKNIQLMWIQILFRPKSRKIALCFNFAIH